MFSVFMILLVQLTNGELKSNLANIKVTCNNDAMHVRLNFEHPFKGIVYTPRNYFNRTCSYASSPTSTVRQLNLNLPLGYCGMEIFKNSDKYTASTTILVKQHRMLDTMYDYFRNVSCELRTAYKASEKPTPKPPLVWKRSWIAFQVASDILPAEVVEASDIGEELLLTYHVLDGGVNRDMEVMNCIGHDDLFIDRNTKIYQLSDPYGCSSDKDLLSSFSVLRNLPRVSNLLAYAVVKNVSLVTRGSFYITCGARLCKQTCQKRCNVVNRQTDPLYLSDIATKGMVNRHPHSVIPVSLSMFERGGRNRREEELGDLSNQTENSNEYLLSKMEESVFANLSENLKNENTKHGLENVNEDSNTSDPLEALENSRSKRRVKLEDTDLSQRMNIIFIPVDHKTLYRTYETAIIKNETNLLVKNNSTTPEVLTEIYAAEERKPCNIKKKCSLNSPMFSSDRYVLNCALRTIIAVFALLCFSGACYSLFFLRQEPNSQCYFNLLN